MSPSKTRPPAVRPGMVARDDLIRGLGGPQPVALVIAPAGYGKTTLLAQWIAQETRPVAWLTVDPLDDDPVALLGALVAAIERVRPVDPSIAAATSKRSRSEAGLATARLAATLSDTDPVVLVIDDVHHLESPMCQDAVSQLLDRLPAGVRVILAGRSWPRTSIVRLRTREAVIEIGSADLALSDTEANDLLGHAGVDPSRLDVGALNAQTEGWAAGLYLFALAQLHGDVAHPPEHLGNERIVGDYISAEFLATLPEDDVRFLEATSVLDRLSGPICDAALETTGSAERLARLERRNLLIVPLDRAGDAYRYHSVLRDALLHRFEARAPGEVAAIRSRAATWSLAGGSVDEAGVYALGSGSPDLVASLVVRAGQQMYALNRGTTLEAWIDWLDANAAIERYPAAASLVAIYRALTGRPADAERWADAADREPAQRPAADGTSPLEGLRSLMRAILCRAGADAMLDDAAAAVALLGPSSPLRPAATFFLGVAHLLAGDTERADLVLEDAEELGHDLAPPAAAAAGAERAVLAVDAGAWAAADELAERAHLLIRTGGIEEYATSALLAAVAAHIATHRGDADRARAEIARANRLRPVLTWALPHLAVQVRLELAAAQLALADAGAARLLAREVGDILRRRPDLGVLTAAAASLDERLAAIGSGATAIPHLTTAELRLLPLLPTHLTFPEIGRELYLSPNTVKTQAISIYRKLGVVSRAAAVTAAIEIGLLDA